jgi:putative transposase
LALRHGLPEEIILELPLSAPLVQAPLATAQKAPARPCSTGPNGPACGCGSSSPANLCETRLRGKLQRHVPDECLNLHWFRTHRHAREEIGRWRNHCNTKRPHSALGYLSQRNF